MEEVASVETASDCPTGIDTSQKTKREIRISLLKDVIYTEPLKNTAFFQSQRLRLGVQKHNVTV